MQGSVHTLNPRRQRHRCHECGRPVTFVGGDGKRRADPQHDLCGRCFHKASRAGTREGKRLLRSGGSW